MYCASLKNIVYKMIYWYVYVKVAVENLLIFPVFLYPPFFCSVNVIIPHNIIQVSAMFIHSVAWNMFNIQLLQKYISLLFRKQMKKHYIFCAFLCKILQYRDQSFAVKEEFWIFAFIDNLKGFLQRKHFKGVMILDS